MFPVFAMSAFQCGRLPLSSEPPPWMQCADPSLWFYDADGDGWGDPTLVRLACEKPGVAYVTEAGDCDDLALHANPGVDEVCDGADDDCDGLVDREDPTLVDARTVFPDADGDDFGVPPGEPGCPTDEGFAATDDDCDDTDSLVFPGATEVAGNLVDDDCDLRIDEVDTTPTETATTGETGTSTCADDLVISEISTSGTEWFVEIYNPTPNAMDLWGTRLEQWHGDTDLLWTAYTFNLGAGDHLLVAGPNFEPSPDGIGPSVLIFDEGAFVLHTPSGGTDVVCVSCGGYPSGPNCAEGPAPASLCEGNWSLERRGGGCQDTDYNTSDFVETRSPTPTNNLGASP